MFYAMVVGVQPQQQQQQLACMSLSAGAKLVLN